MSPQATPENVGKHDDSAKRAAQGAAVSQADGEIDPDLTAVVDAWPMLPEAIKAGILAMVRETLC